VPTNKQRREAERRHLERQLANRRVREAQRRKATLIISVALTIVLIAAIVVTVVVLSSGSDKKNTASKTSKSPTATTTACPGGSKPQKVAIGKGKAVSFNGVTVKGATDMNNAPTVGSTATKPPTKLLVKDLVVGKGAAVNPTSTVKVKYDGVLYCDGTEFDGPAEHGDKAISFSLQGVVPGFTQGIGGSGSIKPMKVGGRRIIIMPAALAYGPSGQGSIPPNAPLAFVVDLTAISTGKSSSSSAG
jgi:peptidylprolyl isomerase